MTDYTKGPWGVFNYNGTICIDNRGGDGRRPCIVDWPGFDGNEMSRRENEANAQLIADSPEMLEALKGILSLLGNVDHSKGGGENTARLYGGMLESIREIASEVIAKAEGRSK